MVRLVRILASTLMFLGIVGADRAYASDPRILDAWFLNGCEPPALYYSGLPGGHRPGLVSCCGDGGEPSMGGACVGGSACVAGVCSDGSRCDLDASKNGRLPNVVLVISDDQAGCHYGFMELCRTSGSGNKGKYGGAVVPPVPRVHDHGTPHGAALLR